MKILLITQWFTPEPDFKGLPFARELLRRGHDVQVITGFPNYPGGHLYPGYRIRWRQRECLDGVPVLRVPLYPSHDRSKFGRAANYLSFFVSASILGGTMTRKPDVIYAYHPPLTTGLAAAVIGAFERVPFVLDIQDMWPDTIAATGMLSNHRLLRSIGRTCRYAYRKAAAITVLSPGFKKLLISRGVQEEKIRVVFNWTDEHAHSPRPRNAEFARSLGLPDDRFIVMFAGTMGRAQALDTVLDAAKIVAAKAPDVLFAFVGSGVESERLRTLASALAETTGNVRFIPRQPMSVMGDVLACADALLVHLRNDPLFRVTIPSKTQAYMAVGKPILMGVEGDAAELVRKANAGICFHPEDAEGLARATLTLRGMSADARAALGENGRQFYEKELSFSAGVTVFETLFASLASRPRL